MDAGRDLHGLDFGNDWVVNANMTSSIFLENHPHFSPSNQWKVGQALLSSYIYASPVINTGDLLFME